MSSDRDNALAVARMAEGYSARFPSVPQVSIAELLELRKELGERMVLVDTRTAEEVNVSRIPGAISQPEFEQRRAAGELPARAHVVAYCTIGLRSLMFCAQLRTAAGAAAADSSRRNGEPEFERVSNLDGSILAWTHSAGGSNVLADSRGQATRAVHVYGQAWNVAHSSFRSVTFEPRTRARKSCGALLAFAAWWACWAAQRLLCCGRCFCSMRRCRCCWWEVSECCERKSQA
jgi:rhodanese-related sulfurtransferase